jgi:PAS domain S-box-containing protein
MPDSGRGGARIASEAARIAAVAVTYAVAAKLGLLVATIGVTVTLVWPASGVAVAALLLLGDRMVIGVALGAFLANATTSAPLPVAVAAAVGNSLEALAASLLLRKLTDFNPRLQRVRDVFSLTLLGAILPPLLAATIGSAGLTLTGQVPRAELLRTWLTWAAGDAIGILLITPLILAWCTRKLDRPSLRRAAELAAMSISTLLVSVLLFGGVIPDRATAPLAFVVYPLLLWAALRFGQRGATTGALVASLIATIWTTRGFGPFARESLGESLVYLNSFIGVATLTGLTVAAAMSERRRATAVAREGESRLRTIMDNLPASVWTTDAWLRITSSQGALLESLGVQAQDQVGTTVMDRTPDPDSATVVAHQRALRGESRDYRITRKGRSFHGHVEPLRSATGEITGTIGMAIDVSEQEATARRYRDLVEQAPVGIYRAAANGKFLEVNDALVVMLGYPTAADLLAVHPATDVYADPREFGRQIETRRSTGKVDPTEVRWRRWDGRIISVHLRGRPFQDSEGREAEFEMIAEDVTERRALEGQLLHAQKMEAVGRLAGGVAHDFNNVLTVILGGVHFLRKDLVADPDLSAMLNEIEHAAERAQGLTHQLLAFSRRQMLAPKVLDLNALVGSVESMLRRLIGEDVELHVAFGAGVHAVKADPGQLEQAIVNLVVNARDAMPDGGRVTLETRNVQLPARPGGDGDVSAGGPYVLLAVVDTGSGMSPEVRAHVFEPFFTTKPRGKGTGLGLPMVYGIVKQSGGFVTVESEPGQGTAVSVFLPSAGVRPEAAPKAPEPPSRIDGNETILLAEDDDGVRHWIHNALQGQGYTVFACRHGKEALGIAEHYDGPIQLLLTDVVMPGMNGRELADRLVASRPKTRILYMSGYTEEALGRSGVGSVAEDRGFLQKPFTPRELLEKVRAMLDRRTPAPAPW